jgi:serine phosphatase RsbU (regulator of sigma subunit)/CHASE2 domain-containing sensor protein
VVIVLASLIQWLLPVATAVWNCRIHDRLFQFRTQSAIFRPAYDDTVVHVDINQSTLQRLNRRHLDRRHHAMAIANLGAMDTATQLYDFVFASERSVAEDQQLVAAAQQARNTSFGLVFLFKQTRDPQTAPAIEGRGRQYLSATRWRIRTETDTQAIPAAVDAIITFPQLAHASRGLGSLNLQYDADGVYRRYPLLYRYEDGVYPSIVLRTVCEYLQVSPAAIVLEPGPCLRLTSVRFPGSEASRDIRIPIDPSGNMIINFIGRWGRMRHYNFADVLQAVEDNVEMALWRDELAGKIVVVSEVLSGASDAGPVPTDTHYPLSGVHANALHTILTESFIKPAADVTRLLSALLLAAGTIAAFVYLPTVAFGLTVPALALAYSGMGLIAFLQYRLLLDFIIPNAVVAALLVSMLVHRAIESTRISLEAERERDLIEKELEIGRRIQADFFPSNLPTFPGWNVAATIRPARQVAGDFYDIFALPGTRLLAAAIGDVCDKGVGAAIFMALFRSLIRAICLQQINDTEDSPPAGQASPRELLQNTVQQTNNYIALTHASACMFATLFLAVIDTQTGEMHYVNCGHEPPLFLTADGRLRRITPTGPAIGAFPEITFGCQSIPIEPGDLLFACTDGVSEAPDANGRSFEKKRLQAIIRTPHPSLPEMLQSVALAVERHSQRDQQFDDITMLAVKRRANDNDHTTSTAVTADRS